MIRSERAKFHNSTLYHLEQFIQRRRGAVADYLGEDSFVEVGDNLQKAFYALVAPSLEGKTQSAFVFRSVRPLYFVLSSSSPTDALAVQPIYSQFDSLSETMRELGEKDLAYIQAKTRNPNSDEALFKTISSTNLSAASFRNTKFYVLGFIMALIEDARAFNGSGSWMHFYATHGRDLVIRPKSLEDFKTFNIENYFMFFDEFVGTYSNVFIRNICRAAKIMVLVANTNTNIANLIGRPQVPSSRWVANAWCLVVTQLNPLNKWALLQMFPTLEAVISDLINRARPDEAPVVSAFFQDFLDIQLEHLRPGFAHYIVQSILGFHCDLINVSFSFGKLLFTITSNLGEDLKIRKPQLINSHESHLGTKALFLKNAYHIFGDGNVDIPLLLHRKEYLNDHFFYLANPVDLTKWCFLVYIPLPPVAGTTSTNISLRIKKAIDGQLTLTNWDAELTLFKEQEIIPFLTFLGMWHDDSIHTILQNGLNRINRSALGTGNAANTAQDVPLNGNALEVLSTVCVVDASHRPKDIRRMDFSGQSGTDFFSNLVKNLIYTDGLRCSSDVVITCPDIRSVGVIFNNIFVPFLFPANLELPEFFKTNFSAPRNYKSRSVNVGHFERVRDSEKIDCKFDAFLSVPLRSPLKAVCTIECKNWQADLSISDLDGIFVKAAAQNSSISILICNSVGGFQDATFSAFKTKCRSKKWDVVKLVRAGTGRKYELRKFHPEIPFTTLDWKMLCVIIELSVINFE